MNLSSKHIVITGAAGGIGRELVLILLKKKATILALDINELALKNLEKTCEDKGYKIETMTVDVTQKQDFEKVFKTLKEKKVFPDIWINNAGINYPKAFDELSEEMFEKIMKVNLDGIILGSRTALRLMKEAQKGMIVNVASLAGHLPSAFMTAYVASKYAVVGFTRALQMELKQQQLPVHAMLVSPAFADTPIMKTNKEFQFPSFLKWCITSPKKVAMGLVKGIEKNAEEVFPGLSCKMLHTLYKNSPKPVFNFVNRLATARNWKELIGLEGIRSR